MGMDGNSEKLTGSELVCWRLGVLLCIHVLLQNSEEETMNFAEGADLIE
jgi:hypothetical protein